MPQRRKLPCLRYLFGMWIVLGTGSTSLTQAQEGASQIRDIAGMFDLETVRKGRASLDKLEREFHVPILIETIDTLKSDPIDDAAARRNREWGDKGIYILIAQDNHRISRVHLAERLRRRRPEARPDVDPFDAIRGAFIAQFRKGDFDAGLDAGIAALRSALTQTQGARSDAASDATKAPERATEPAREAPLVVRHQVRLTLAGARRILAEAEARATAMKLKVNIAVVDDGGHLIAFARMDGARPASGYTALTKAATAATFRQPTGPIPPGSSAPDPLLNLSLQNAAAASGGKLTTLPGGVPIVVDGQVIGGVGVGGGTGEQDAEVARAGITALLEELKKDGAEAK